MTDEAQAEQLADVVVEAILEDQIERAEAQASRECLEAVLWGELERAQQQGPAAMGEWWLTYLALVPVRNYLRTVEHGKAEVGEQYLDVIGEIEQSTGLPAFIAGTLGG